LYNQSVNDPTKSFDESALKNFPATFESLEQQGILTPTVTLDLLRAKLSADQQVIVDQIINLKPRDFGVDTPYAGDLEPVPADLVKVSSQQYTEHGEQKTLSDKYVPRHIFEAYVRMNDAFMAGHPSLAFTNPGQKAMSSACGLSHGTGSTGRSNGSHLDSKANSVLLISAERPGID
jgi:hypothetical protein